MPIVKIVVREAKNARRVHAERNLLEACGTIGPSVRVETISSNEALIELAHRLTSEMWHMHNLEVVVEGWHRTFTEVARHPVEVEWPRSAASGFAHFAEEDIAHAIHINVQEEPVVAIQETAFSHRGEGAGLSVVAARDS